MKHTRWIAPLALAVSLACSASVVTGADGLKLAIGSDGALASFTTDSNSYTATRVEELWPGVFVYGFTVVTHYTNPTPDPLYLWTCYPDARTPMYSVMLAGQPTSAGAAYNAAWACVGHDRPIRVGPGATRVDTLYLRGPNGFDGVTHRPIDPVLEGRFQLQFAVQSCRTEGDCPIRDEALTRSSEFTVKLER